MSGVMSDLCIYDHNISTKCFTESSVSQVIGILTTAHPVCTVSYNCANNNPPNPLVWPNLSWRYINRTSEQCTQSISMCTTFGHLFLCNRFDAKMINGLSTLRPVVETNPKMYTVHIHRCQHYRFSLLKCPAFFLVFPVGKRCTLCALLSVKWNIRRLGNHLPVLCEANSLCKIVCVLACLFCIGPGKISRVIVARAK